MNLYKLDKKNGYGSFLVHDGVINGCTVYVHYLSKNSILNLEQNCDFIRVIFFSEGRGESVLNGISLPVRTTYVPDPRSNDAIRTDADSVILEIRIAIEMNDLNTELPLVLGYDDSRQYSESCKSEKTINRMILLDGILPGFAMGSVETIGPDTVADDCHPEVDQFFFTLPEHYSKLLIDGEPHELSGNSIVHIPLGAVHGSIIPEGAHMHYLWCDFMVSEESHAYMSAAHVFNDEKRSF